MSNEKPIYRLMDGKGRVYIPQDLRALSGMQPYDIIRIIPQANGIFIRKVDIIEVGDHSAEAQQAYAMAAFKYMNPAEKQKFIVQIMGEYALCAEQ